MPPSERALQTFPGLGDRLSKVIRQKRLPNGARYTQSALSKDSGVSRQTVNLAINAHKASQATVRAMASALGVEDGELLTFNYDADLERAMKPQAARELQAQARLDLVRAGLSDEQIARAIIFIESDTWHHLWVALRGPAPEVDMIVEAMRIGLQAVLMAIGAAKALDPKAAQLARDEIKAHMRVAKPRPAKPSSTAQKKKSG